MARNSGDTMKPSLAIFCCAALLSGTALAEDNDKTRDNKSDSFATLDADSDGKLSKDEASGNASLAASFDRLDSNSDGYVSRKEFRRNTMPKPSGTQF
jgi:Ca2+-binding EF-hand superfamily protein